ncbi:uncharacterized protein LOC142344158 [Convolutriloba macropyga]|uniref:uncharacterized protein LOC142344158 n=1 Tax=Convolutriloba macropyga TaxID=536237 RepID=UPI003F525F72
MYDPDTYRKYKAPDNVIPPSIGLVTYELYTLMFQAVALMCLTAVMFSEEWLATEGGDLSHHLNAKCLNNKASELFEITLKKFNESKKNHYTNYILDQQYQNKKTQTPHSTNSSVNTAASTNKRRHRRSFDFNAKMIADVNKNTPGFYKAIEDPTFDRVLIGNKYGCMQSRTSYLDLALNNYDFLNYFDPLQIFTQNFTQIRNEDVDPLLAAANSTLTFIMKLFPAVYNTSWTICSKCMAVTAGVYGGPRNVLVWCLPVLALSMLFLSVSAISAKALHDSHALPKITAFLGSFIQMATSIILVVTIILLLIIQMECDSRWLFSMAVAFMTALLTFVPSLLILVVVLRYKNISYEGM